ncbi:MAG: hypothetical protein HYV07_25305 [Deltaproteobacteria bacterium]|nr:hypothetical protein [Deltaproteobacteria bacterium]
MRASYASGETPWSPVLDERIARFCREDVAKPWLEVIRYNRGERGAGWIEPFLGFGPKLPLSLIASFSPMVVQFALGRRANLLTLILNRARNRIVYLCAERAERGKYVELLRLDDLLSGDQLDRLLRLVQAGAEDDALRLTREILSSRDLGRLAPDVLKVADLSFFEAFAELAELERAGRTREWLRACGAVGRRVLRERLLYFHPAVPFERLLSVGRRAAS